jgi:hypothetical protein
VESDERQARRILGVAAEAGPDEIRHAYRARAREHHPDRHASAPAEERARHATAFAEANAAWMLLRGGARPLSTGGTAAEPHLNDLDLDDVDDLDFDDGAISASRPGCLAIGLPVVLLAVAIVVFAVASLFQSRVLWQTSLAVGALAGVAFILAPFVTMVRGRR